MKSATAQAGNGVFCDRSSIFNSFKTFNQALFYISS
jgi:hypothetical protein